jgi:hypothetical protein
VPEIKEGKVVFPSGKTLEYQAERRVHASAEEALRKGEPVSISERPVLIESWKRLALIRVAKLYEGETQEVSLYNYEGTLLSPPRKITGVVFLLEKVNRILLAQQSAHYLVTESYLLDVNGQLVRTISQPQNVSAFGFSNDERLIWIISNSLANGRPVGELRLLDSDGVLVEKLTFAEAKEVEVDYRGKQYRIKVAAPQMPG